MNWRNSLDNAFHVILGKFYLRKCTRTGKRIRVYGRPRINNWGEINIGDRFILFNQTVRSEMVAYSKGKIEIGNRVFINYGASISAHQLVSIGDECQIGSYVIMMDNDYHQVEDRTKPGISAPIILEKNVWLGVRVVVLKGIRIGENSVIGANSVVSRDIPPNCLAGGVPARIIRTFSGQK